MSSMIFYLGMPAGSSFDGWEVAFRRYNVGQGVTEDGRPVSYVNMPDFMKMDITGHWIGIAAEQVMEPVLQVNLS